MSRKLDLPMGIVRSPLILALLVLWLVPLTASAQQEQLIDEIVAQVDEEVILRSELESTLNTLEAQFAARGERMPPRSVLEEQVLERLIMSRIEVMRAEQTGIRVSDQEVDRALGDVAAQNNLTLTQLRRAIEADGFDFNEFRDEIRREILSSRLRQRIVDSMDEVTATEVDILLASERFGGDEYHLSQILVQLPDSASPDQIRQAEQRAQEVYQRLGEGMDFTTAAITYSQAPDALDGGTVGWRNLNTMPRQIADLIENVQVGEVAPPVRVAGGILILRVNDRRPRSEIIVREYNARHIMIEETELVSPEQARQRIHEIHDQIREGGDFAALARQWSDDVQTANLGGSLDWFPEGAYGPMIQDVIDKLRPGEVSEPFQTLGAWHLVKLEDTREADRTEEALRNEAREMIMSQKADEEIDRVLRQMRSEAYVRVKL